MLSTAQGGDWETTDLSSHDSFVRGASYNSFGRMRRDGKTVREGDRVLLWFVSGNRDSEVLKDPFEIDVARTPNRHIAFGQGCPHVCLGMWLPRLEVRILLQEFVKRVKALEQSGAHEFLRSNFIGGIGET